MDFKFLKAYDYLQDIICLTDLETLEIRWINQAGKKIFGPLTEGVKCYEYFYGLSTSCAHCHSHELIENFQKYAGGEMEYCHNRAVQGVSYRSRKTTIEIEGRKYSLDTIYNVDEFIRSLHQQETANKIYVKLLSEITEIDITDDIESQVRHILEMVKQIFKARRVSMMKTASDADFPVISVKEEGISDFYYNPIMKDVLKQDARYASKMEEDRYILIQAEEIERIYPEISAKMRIEGNTNFILLEWNIEGDRYLLIIENAQVILEDKKVFKLIYNYLYFIIRSFLYNKTLYQLSNLDSLTNLFNRNKYNYDIANSYTDTQYNLGVLYLDLDNLKDVNDSFGHIIGDKLLIATSKILRESFSKASIYRVGGDEFIVITRDTPYPEFMKQIETMRRRMDNGKIFSSYGVEYQAETTELTEMITGAEREMYVYKRRHHDKYSYDIERNAILQKIKGSLLSDQFYLVLQPKINPYTGCMVGAEALIRGRESAEWQYPNEFIPLFEKNNCIDLIDYFMLEEACRLQRYILDTYEEGFPISVNISRTTLLLPTFEEDTLELLKKYNIPLNLIHLEVTERMDVSSEDILAHGLRLKKYGLQLEVDDFGSHFTNLSFLGRDVFSVVKIDKTIFAKLKNDSITAKLIELVISECHKRNVTVLAEGVETEEDLALIKSMYIDEVQGYYYDKPMLPEAFMKKYLEKQKADT